MTNHTPGPWRVSKLGGEPMVYGPQGAQIVNMRDALVFADENEANARLIAAAPELLAVLQSFVNAWAEQIDKDKEVNGSDAVDFIAGYLDDARAAIAKAKGA